MPARVPRPWRDLVIRLVGINELTVDEKSLIRAPIALQRKEAPLQLPPMLKIPGMRRGCGGRAAIANQRGKIHLSSYHRPANPPSGISFVTTVRPYRTTIQTTFALALLISTHADCAEILTNGNLESFLNGNPTSWTYQRAVDEPATLESSANVSPFTNVYSSSTRSALLTDGVGQYFTPILSQGFALRTGLVVLSFDFRLSSLAGEPWHLLPTTTGGLHSQQFALHR